MTKKDIRDIAAYYGSPCINAWIDLRIAGRDNVVNAAVLESLEAGASPELKVRLRPIASLTDEEKWHCAQLAGHQDRESHYFVITGENDLLFYDDASGGGVGHVISPVYNPGAIVAYLQSIGVYVQGTIDEKYVNLVDA